jgi:hypothetical protein
MANKNETATVDVIINGQKANASLNEMRSAVRQLNAEMGKIAEPLNSAEFKRGQQAVDDLKAKIIDITGKAKETGTAFSGLSSEVTGMVGKFIGWGAAIAGVGSFFKSAIDNAIKEESALQKLTFALNGDSDAVRRMVEFRQNLLKTTLFSKDDINDAINYGLTLGHNTEETKKLVEAAMALNKASGDSISIHEALTLIQQSYTGNLRMLSRYLVDADGNVIHLTKSQLENGGAVDALISKYGTYLTSGLETVSGRLKTLSTNWQEFTESIGIVIIPALGALLGAINNLFNFTGKEDPLSKMKTKQQEDIDYFLALDKENQKKYLEDQKKTADQYFKIWKDTKNAYVDPLSANYSAIYAKEKDIAKEAATSYDTQKEFIDKLNKLYSQAHPAQIIDPGDLKKAQDQMEKNHQITLANMKEEMALGIKSPFEVMTAEIEFTKQTTAYKEASEKARGDMINKIRLEYEKIDERNQEESNKKQLESSKQLLAEQKKDLENAAKDSETAGLVGLQISKTDELGQLRTQLQNKIITIEEYKIKEKELNEKYDQLILQSSIDVIEKQIAAEKALGFDVGELERKLADLKISLSKSVSKSKDTDIEEQKNADKKLENFEYQSASKAVSELTQLFATYYDTKLMRLDEAGTADEKEKQKELDSAKGNKKQEDQINAKFLKQEQERDKEKRKILHDQAVYNKAAGAVQVIINTAVAAMAQASIPIVGWIMAALTIALGAVELATVLAQPIPAAAKGRYNVIGKGDGKQYNDVPYEQSPKTGMYTRPTLFAETGNEIIIDPITTKNLVMNYPGIIDAINFARIPQRALGNYIQTTSTPVQTNNTQDKNNDRLTIALEKFNAHADQGLVALISYDYDATERAKLAAINRDVSK